MPVSWGENKEFKLKHILKDNFFFLLKSHFRDECLSWQCIWLAFLEGCIFKFCSMWHNSGVVLKKLRTANTSRFRCHTLSRCSPAGMDSSTEDEKLFADIWKIHIIVSSLPKEWGKIYFTKMESFVPVLWSISLD